MEIGPLEEGESENLPLVRQDVGPLCVARHLFAAEGDRVGARHQRPGLPERQTAPPVRNDLVVRSFDDGASGPQNPKSSARKGEKADQAQPAEDHAEEDSQDQVEKVFPAEKDVDERSEGDHVPEGRQAQTDQVLCDRRDERRKTVGEVDSGTLFDPLNPGDRRRAVRLDLRFGRPLERRAPPFGDPDEPHDARKGERNVDRQEEPLPDFGVAPEDRLARLFGQIAADPLFARRVFRENFIGFLVGVVEPSPLVERRLVVGVDDELFSGAVFVSDFDFGTEPRPPIFNAAVDVAVDDRAARRGESARLAQRGETPGQELYQRKGDSQDEERTEEPKFGRLPKSEDQLRGALRPRSGLLDGAFLFRHYSCLVCCSGLGLSVR